MLKRIADIRNYANYSGFGTGRDLVNGWLEWKYGWKPLMGDLFGILDESIRQKLNTIQRIRASAKRPLNGLGKIQRYIHKNSWDVISAGSGIQSCRMSMVIEIRGGFALDRWSSLNPVSVTWELIPYSFVVDWFYDVGSYLRNLETGLLYNSLFKSGYYSELYAYEGTETAIQGQRINYLGNNPPKIEMCEYARSSIKYIEFYRTKMVSYPLPRPPVFQADLGSEQLFTLAGLLSQMIK